MNLKIYLFLFNFVIVVRTSNVIIRKCCDYGESLNRLTLCSNETESDSTDWIPKVPFIIHSSKSTMKISEETVFQTLKKVYSGKVTVGFPKCDMNLRDSAIAWPEPDIPDQFYLIYDADKKVQLNLKRDTVYHNNVSLAFSKMFSPDSYCVEKGPSDSYIALICPCHEVTCIRKCCFPNMVFDEEKKKCISIDSLNLTDSEYDAFMDWRPEFEKSEFDFEDEEPDIEYYLLSGKLPSCATYRGVHIEKNEEGRSFFFDSEGDVKVKLSDGTIKEVPSGEHCGELGWRSGRLSPLLLRCFSQRVAESLEEAKQRSDPYGASLTIAAILLALAALGILYSGELKERKGARQQLAHVASLAVAHFAAAFKYFLTETIGGFFCIFSATAKNPASQR